MRSSQKTPADLTCRRGPERRSPARSSAAELSTSPDAVTSHAAPKMAEQQQHSRGPDDEDEAYEMLALTSYARTWSTVFGSSSGPIAQKYSVATQIMTGGAAGWCAGYLFQRVGKVAATAVGGGFLLLQIANHSGYVQVDWKKVETDVNKAKRRLKKKANNAAPEINTFIEQATEFVKKNMVASSGFVGGFLLGLAS